VSWRIRFSSKNEVGFVANGLIRDRIESSAAWAKKFETREAGVAWVLRYVDAKIVSSVDQLSTTEPTCFIEEIIP